MKPLNDITKQLAEQAVLTSLIHGGIAQSELKVRKSEEGIVLQVATPSLREDNYHLQVTQNSLSLYTSYGEGTDDNRPAFANSLPLPTNVDKNKIEAIFKDGELKVFLPFLVDEDLKPRNVEIKKYNNY